MTTFKRKPLSFLFFTNELKLWYFKYIVGAIVISMVVVGLTIYILISKYTKIITILTTNLPKGEQLPVEIVKDIVSNLKFNLIYVLSFEAIILLISGIFMSMFFAHKLMGPLKRIEKETNEMLSGVTPLHPITLRKGDYLAPVIELMNTFINVLSKKSELAEEFKYALKNIKTIIKEEASD